MNGLLAVYVLKIGVWHWELTRFCLPSQRDIERWYQVNNWVICQPISDIETARINNLIQFSVADGVKWTIINQNFRLNLEALLGVRACLPYYLIECCLLVNAHLICYFE